MNLCCQICEPITTGLAPIRAPGNLGTTAANIAQSWKSFLESAEKSADDAAAQRALALLKSDRVCHLVVTRALESLLIAARVEMELRVRDLACPTYLRAIVDRTAPQKYLADERVSVLRLLHYNLKLSDMGSLPPEVEALRRVCEKGLSAKLPPSMSGGLPGRGTEEVLTQIQLALEGANTKVSGLVLDILKVFNANVLLRNLDCK